jgi:hypothetical protein
MHFTATREHRSIIQMQITPKLLSITIIHYSTVLFPQNPNFTVRSSRAPRHFIPPQLFGRGKAQSLSAPRALHLRLQFANSKYSSILQILFSSRTEHGMAENENKFICMVNISFNWIVSFASIVRAMTVMMMMLVLVRGGGGGDGGGREGRKRQC